MYAMWQSLLLVLFWTRIVLSSPLAVNNPLSLTSTNLNLTDSIANTIAPVSQFPIPGDFKLFPYRIRRSSLPREAYYYNIIAALGTVALNDFDGVISTPKNFQSARFPQLPLRFSTPPPSGRLPTKYAVWSLTLAPVFLIEEIGFSTVTFDLQWQEKGVGKLVIEDITSMSKLLEGPSNQTDKVTHNPTPPIDDITHGAAALEKSAEATNLTVPSNGNRIGIIFEYYGRVLDKQSVFLAVISSLSDAAAFHALDEVPGHFTSFFVGQHAQFTAEATGVVPFYYTYQVLLAALVQATDYMVEKNNYHELKMQIQVNSIVIANAALSWKEDPHLVASGSSNGSSAATA